MIFTFNLLRPFVSYQIKWTRNRNTEMGGYYGYNNADYSDDILLRNQSEIVQRLNKDNNILYFLVPSYVMIGFYPN